MNLCIILLINLCFSYVWIWDWKKSSWLNNVNNVACIVDALLHGLIWKCLWVYLAWITFCIQCFIHAWWLHWWVKCLYKSNYLSVFAFEFMLCFLALCDAFDFEAGLHRPDPVWILAFELCYAFWHYFEVFLQNTSMGPLCLKVDPSIYPSCLSSNFQSAPSNGLKGPFLLLLTSKWMIMLFLGRGPKPLSFESITSSKEPRWTSFKMARCPYLLKWHLRQRLNGLSGESFKSGWW